MHEAFVMAMCDTFINLEEVFEGIEDRAERERRIEERIERNASYPSRVDLTETGKGIRHDLLRIKKTYIFFYDNLVD